MWVRSPAIILADSTDRRGDGSVQFVSDQIDADLWQRLGNRSDGQLINDLCPD